MTKKTERLYFILWGKAYKAHWKGERAGEALSRPDRPAVCEMREQVLRAARMVAMREGGSLSADCLRHGCHIVATGKDCGHHQLTHKQTTQVLAVFRQLAGIDLSAMAETAAGDRERTTRRAGRAAAASGVAGAVSYPVAGREAALAGIQRLGFTDEYIGRITGDRWRTANWRGLGDMQLTQLLMTLKARAAVRAIADNKRTVLTGGL